MIAIINYGMGNLGSIVNMFKKIGVNSVITSDINQINDADKILLPGVGSFDRAMEKINSLGLNIIINKQALEYKKPTLGICLGMQLLTNGSEEGHLKGLNLIEAQTVKFPNIEGLRIPHMGWNFVEKSTESSLTANLPELSRFYFVHSYYVKVENEINSILKCNYGVKFDAAIQKDNVYGAQFHPEKSHKFGLQLLKNFSELK